uniref:RING-type domain-containing protein n=1 Tax=Meloidogyne incognita TaxID=6306 RepID=A0A914M533_MELIC
MINVGQIFFDKSSVKAVTDIIKIDETLEDENCIICHLNLIEVDQKILQKTDCDHIFHKECLQKWVGQNMHGKSPNMRIYAPKMPKICTKICKICQNMNRYANMHERAEMCKYMH